MAQPVRRRLRLSSNSLRSLAWLLSLGLAAWVLSQLPLLAFIDAVSQIGFAEWLIWIGVNLLVVTLLSSRWLIIMRAMDLHIGLMQVMGIRQAGQLISFVTPGPQFGGEPAQIFWLWSRYSTSGPTAFLSVGLDRFYELSVNFAVLLIALLVLALTAGPMDIDWLSIALAVTAMALIVVLSGWAILRRPEVIRRWLKRITSLWQNSPRLENLDSHWSALNAQLQQLIERHKRPLVMAILLSLAGWCAMILEFWYLLLLAGVPVDTTTLVLLFAVMRLAFLLPLPGGIGSLEAAMLWGFQTLSLPLEMAATAIVLMRLRDAVVLLSGAMVLPYLSSGRQAGHPGSRN